MVIVVPKDSVGPFLLLVLLLAGALLFLASPVMLMAGIASLIFQEMSVGASIALGVAGLLLATFALWFIIGSDLEERQKGKKTGKSNLIIFMSFVGIVEIIVGIVQQNYSIEFFLRFTLIGGGCITFLPAAIYMIIVINRQNSGKLRNEVRESKIKNLLNRSGKKDKSGKAVDPRHKPKKQLIDTLVERGDQESVNYFCAMLQNGNNKDKMMALWALGKINDKQAIPFIFDTLSNDADVYVRMRAVEILEKMGDKQVIVPLRAMLQEEKDYQTRKRIEMAINNLESGKSGEQIREMFQPICTSCGEENTKNKPFCVSCGGSLTD